MSKKDSNQKQEKEDKMGVTHRFNKEDYSLMGGVRRGGYVILC